MKIMVTGGAGFLGSHVVSELLRAGHEVVIFDSGDATGVRARNASIICGNLLDLPRLTAASQGIDAICHLAGVGDVYLAASEPATAAAANVLGTTNVAEAARRNSVGRVIYASTWEVYGELEHQPVRETHPCAPDHPYNITKYAGELMALASDRLQNVPTVALRLGTAYGLGMRPNSVFARFIATARSGEPITIQGTGLQSRQFTHARDIARGFRLAVESTVRGCAINLVAEENVSIQQLAEMVVARYPTAIRYGEARAGDIHPALIDSSLAWELFGWKGEVCFRDGLAELLDEATVAA